jgi:hypothetical protein
VFGLSPTVTLVVVRIFAIFVIAECLVKAAKIFFVAILDGYVTRIALKGYADAFIEPATEVDLLATGAAKRRSWRKLKEELLPAGRTFHGRQLRRAVGLGSVGLGSHG